MKLLGIVLIFALVMILGTMALAEGGDGNDPVQNDLSTNTPVTHTVSTSSTTHTYEIYQIFTGTKSGEQLINLKYGTNAATGTAGESVSDTDMAALDDISNKNYANDQEKISDLKIYVTLTNPVATLGKNGKTSTDLAEGYYIIKDKDNSLSDPETYTLYLFKVLNDDLEIQPKDGTTTVDKTVTETDDTAGTATAGQKGADYDQGDSIPYSIDITFAKNVTDYKCYKVTLTDELSDGLTPPEKANIAWVLKDENGNVLGNSAGNPVLARGEVTVELDDQLITVGYIAGNTGAQSALGNDYAELNKAVLTVSYEAVLNENAVVGDAGNPNTYSILYTNNPNNFSGEGTTPDQKVYVYTYELEIEKKDGNGEPLQGAGFTLYKEVAGTTTPATEEGGEPTTTYPTGAQSGATIKAALPKGSKVDMSKLNDAKYYVAVSMTESVTKDGDTVTRVSHKTSTKIDAGNYVLVETTVPAGYNAYEGMEITVTHIIDADIGALKALTASPNTLTIASHTYGEGSEAVVSGKAEVNGQVENNSGTVLPSTGGIGTTIFYVVGSIMVVAAGVLLITKKRMGRNR